MIPNILHNRQELEPRWNFNTLSPRIATITNPRGERHTTYFGFNDRDKAQEFCQEILIKKECSRAFVRKSERMTNYEWEIKAWDISTEFINILINRKGSPFSMGSR